MEIVYIDDFETFDDLINFTYSMSFNGIRVTVSGFFNIIIFPIDRGSQNENGIRFGIRKSVNHIKLEEIGSIAPHKVSFRIFDDNILENHYIRTPKDLQNIIDYYHLLRI